MAEEEEEEEKAYRRAGGGRGRTAAGFLRGKWETRGKASRSIVWKLWRTYLPDRTESVIWLR